MIVRSENNLHFIKSAQRFLLLLCDTSSLTWPTHILISHLVCKERYQLESSGCERLRMRDKKYLCCRALSFNCKQQKWRIISKCIKGVGAKNIYDFRAHLNMSELHTYILCKEFTLYLNEQIIDCACTSYAQNTSVNLCILNAVKLRPTTVNGSIVAFVF